MISVALSIQLLYFPLTQDIDLSPSDQISNASVICIARCINYTGSVIVATVDENGATDGGREKLNIGKFRLITNLSGNPQSEFQTFELSGGSNASESLLRLIDSPMLVIGFSPATNNKFTFGIDKSYIQLVNLVKFTSLRQYQT